MLTHPVSVIKVFLVFIFLNIILLLNYYFNVGWFIRILNAPGKYVIVQLYALKEYLYAL